MYNKFNLLRKYFTENYPQIPKEALSDYVLSEILDIAKEELKASEKIVSDAEQANESSPLDSVFVLQHKETRRLHGCFDNREKAESYANGSTNISIMELEIA